jgi:integrase
VSGSRKKKTTGKTNRDDALKWVDENLGPVLRSQGQIRALEDSLAAAKGTLNRSFLQAWDEFAKRPFTSSDDRKRQIHQRWDLIVEWLVAEGISTLGRIDEDTAFAWWKMIDASDYSPNVRNDLLKIAQKVLGASAVKVFDQLPNWPQPRCDRGQKPFTPSQLDLIRENQDDPCYPLIMLGVNTGLSLKDAIYLQWDEIDSVTGLIRINRRKTGTRCTIPILPWLSDWLSGHERGDSEFVFPEWNSAYEQNRMMVSRSIQSYLQGCGLNTMENSEGKRARTVYGFHSCRHTFAWMAEANGVPLSIIQAMVGHTSSEMTKRYTEHATEEQILKYMIGINQDGGDLRAQYNELFDLVVEYISAKGLLTGRMNMVLGQHKERELVSYLKERI